MNLFQKATLAVLFTALSSVCFAEDNQYNNSENKIRMKPSSVHDRGKGKGTLESQKPNMLMGMFKKLEHEMSKEERENLKRLYEEDRSKFRQVIREKFRQIRLAKQKKHKIVMDLAKKYRTSNSEEEKKQIKEKIRQQTREQFYENMEMNRKNLEESEKRLKQVKAKFEQRMKNADEIIEKRVEDLTSDPDLKW